LGGIQSPRAGHDFCNGNLLDHDMGGEDKMSGTFAIVLAVLSLGSCLASYMLGRDSMRQQMRDRQERMQRWEEFDDQD
jgi:hypothetical protein